MNKLQYENSLFYVPGENDPYGSAQGWWSWMITLQGTEKGTGRSMTVTRIGTVDPGADIKRTSDLRRQVYSFVIANLTPLMPGAVTLWMEVELNDVVQS